jgi:hypothetical protein
MHRILSPIPSRSSYKSRRPPRISRLNAPPARICQQEEFVRQCLRIVAAENDQAGGLGLVVDPKKSPEIDKVSPAASVKFEVPSKAVVVRCPVVVICSSGLVVKPKYGGKLVALNCGEGLLVRT